MVKLLTKSDLNCFFKLLNEIDDEFSPSLSSRVTLDEYTLKLLTHATVFGIFQQEYLVGAIAVYMNDLESGVGYCPFIGVSFKNRKQGLSQKLLDTAISNLKDDCFKILRLTVKKDSGAFFLYKKNGFHIVNKFTYSDTNVEGYEMELKLS
ncbi:GNAT family N-acetyltransferase [Pseudoalteromonas sp. MMG010]|uniref:GNAT family N-acetyltransferase n=1 Tax=Pseudoalteromonas sp. MMG010 TaxID=2822685 RepID=UPI001B3A0CF8|nr:GNAT family N-acetyltransferase [Pseudoalteromonas sp. MMG010]MBQ4834224.1 GNAT family N-acetyltransferase [Pseudoalteromonas sp. MMG010]